MALSELTQFGITTIPIWDEATVARLLCVQNLACDIYDNNEF